MRSNRGSSSSESSRAESDKVGDGGALGHQLSPETGLKMSEARIAETVRTSCCEYPLDTLLLGCIIEYL